MPYALAREPYRRNLVVPGWQRLARGDEVERNVQPHLILRDRRKANRREQSKKQSDFAGLHDPSSSMNSHHLHGAIEKQDDSMKEKRLQTRLRPTVFRFTKVPAAEPEMASDKLQWVSC
jgi:phenylalanyl-tRNA synthetase alpha subunit